MGVSNNNCQRDSSRGDNIYICGLESLSQNVTEFDLNALRGKTVRVIADNMLPYITYSKASHELSGYLGDIWAIIQTGLEFKSNVTLAGYDEGVDLITRGHGDVMLAAVVAKRGLNNLEYSQPYFYNWYRLYIKKPKAVASSSSYLRTLDDELWFASLSLFLALSFFLWLSMWIINRFTGQDKVVSLPSCLFSVCGGFLNQGYDAKIKCYSGRTQVFVALVFGFLLYSAMNAVLVAQLAIFDHKLPFNELDELPKLGTHSLCVRTNSFVYNYFTDVNRTILPKWRDTVNGVGCLDINEQENVAKVICRDNVVVLESRVVMRTIRRQYKLPCELTSTKRKLFIKQNSFMLLKSFKGKGLIHLYMKLLASRGILQRLVKMWVGKKPQSDGNYQPTTSPVTINHVSGILITLASMILISLLILIVEISINSYINHSTN